VKKLLTVAVLLALAALAQGQMGSPPGVPASALSITPSRPNPGVPPSVTSYSSFHPPQPYVSPTLGFSINNPPPLYGPVFRQSQGMRFSGGFGFNGGFRHHRHHFNGGYGTAYAYPVYVPVEPNYDQSYDAEAEAQAAAAAAAEPSGNAMERELWSRAAQRSDNSLDRRDAGQAEEDNDSRYGEHYLDGRESQRRVAAAPPPEPAGPPETSAILVLKDGTRVELANYAILGQTIFDLAHHNKKIQLADVDAAATQNANDEHGYDFKLPAR
jgi:hypothetical protein